MNMKYGVSENCECTKWADYDNPPIMVFAVGFSVFAVGKGQDS